MITNVNIINKSPFENPKYGKEGDAGMDLRASFSDDWFLKNNIEINLYKSVVLKPRERLLIPTDIYINLPKNYEAQIRPRSGLALKNGITVLNTPGTIDPPYQGHIQIILFNSTNKPFIINNGDRIAQMVITKFETINWINVDEFTEQTERGKEGFGHTGTK